MALTLLAVDPGVGGGFCRMDLEGNVLEVRKMPETERDVLDYFLSLKGTGIRAIMEKVTYRPGKGGKGAFTQAMNLGNVRTSIMAAEIPLDQILPATWQKIYQLPKPENYDAHKRALKVKAQELFPHLNVFLWNADCMLLAEYFRRQQVKT